MFFKLCPAIWGVKTVSRIICEKNAKSLFTDLVKKEIDSKIEEYERANLPISEAVSKIKEKYEFWSKIPKPSQDMTTYYCWIDFIEPYLKDREGPEDSKFTVGSVIIAFFYMYKKAFYPFPEITQNGKRMEFYRKLAEKYSVSVNSLKNDWNLLQNKDCRIKRPESISLAIEILKTFNDPKVSEAIDLAKAELREAELKS